jgi:hypothetical protein
MHNNSADYYFYLSLMRQGAAGHWLTTIPFTTESHRASVVFTYFLILGKLAHVFNLSMEVGYLLARIGGSLLFFTSAWMLIKKIKTPYPTFSYLIFLFASPFLRPVTENGVSTITPFLYWWTGIDPIRRASYLPHHMMGGFLLVTLLTVIINFFENKKSSSPLRFFLITTILLTLILLIHTPSLLIFAITISFTIGFFILKKIIRDLKENKVFSLKEIAHRDTNPKIIQLIVILGICLMLMLSFAYYMGLDPLWKHALEWEKTLQLPFAQEILGGFGILLPFAIIGSVLALKKNSFPYLLICCWFLLPLLLLPIASIFGISNTRLIQGAPFLPYSILCTIGIEWAFNYIVKIKKTLAKPMMVLVISAFLIQSTTTLFWSYKDIIREYWTYYTNIYLDKNLFTAFDFINTNYKPDTIVLSTFYTGNYIPAFSHTKSYVGHFGYTQNLEQKQKEVDAFFSGKLSDKEARDFITSRQITLIFDSEEEKQMHTNPIYPSILKSVYVNSVATIYELKK